MAKNERTHLRLSKNCKEILKKEAELNGLSLSAHIERIVIEHADINVHNKLNLILQKLEDQKS